MKCSFMLILDCTMKQVIFLFVFHHMVKTIWQICQKYKVLWNLPKTLFKALTCFSFFMKHYNYMTIVSGTSYMPCVFFSSKLLSIRIKDVFWTASWDLATHLQYPWTVFGFRPKPHEITVLLLNSLFSQSTVKIGNVRGFFFRAYDKNVEKKYKQREIRTLIFFIQVKNI